MDHRRIINLLTEKDNTCLEAELPGARRGNEGGIGKKHGETLPTGFGSAGKCLLFYFQNTFV